MEKQIYPFPWLNTKTKRYPITVVHLKIILILKFIMCL